MLIFDQLKKNDPALRALTVAVLLGSILLVAGLWYVQIISHRDYAEDQKAQAFRTVRIPAVRGKILDRHGRPLAENQPSYNVAIYLDEMREQFRQEWQRSRPPGRKLARAERVTLEAQCRYRVVSNAAQHVARVLQMPVPLEYGKFLRHYTNQLPLPLQLLTGLQPAQVARFQEQPSAVPGLDLDVHPMRFYPHATTAAHVLGYLARDDSSAEDEDAFFNFRLPDYRGRVGIEGAFDDDLRGRAGVKSVLVNSLGYRQSENIWTAAEPGHSLVLTLDLTIQQAAEQALAAAGATVRGAVVVLDPNNGDLLALVSAPAYDPNKFIPNISREDFALFNDPALRPEVNRATQENYRPGSIFKIVTAMACLEAGLDPHETIYNPGHIYIGRRMIKDTAAPGEYDFKRAFIKSSNTYFITNGLRAGIERIARIGERLHLGERAGLPTGQEVSGTFPKLKAVRLGWAPGDTANLCIGQGQIDVTPLQMAIMTAAIANGGKVYWPRLVDHIAPADAQAQAYTMRFPAGRVRDELGVRPATLRLIREAMLADVEEAEGTGKAAAVPGLRVCGKTGTAQITDPQNRVIGHTLWFTSFAPHDVPRYVVLVMVESEYGGSGGLVCAPIARKIYRTLLQSEGVSVARNP